MHRFYVDNLIPELVERKNNIGYHEIEYFNNPNKSFDSNKAVSIFHDRTKRNRNYIINILI